MFDRTIQAAPYSQSIAKTVHEHRAPTEARRKNAALRGEITKQKKRVGNGVCPFCKRTFSQLQKHMECKHPEYKAEAQP